MTSLTQKLNGEPIILMTVDDNADKSAVVEAYNESIELANTISGPVYRIIDLQKAPLSYQYIMTAIQDMVKGLVGAAVYPQMAIAWVGNPDMTETSGMRAGTFFTHFEDALAHTRAQIAEGISA